MCKTGYSIQNNGRWELSRVFNHCDGLQFRSQIDSNSKRCLAFNRFNVDPNPLYSLFTEYAWKYQCSQLYMVHKPYGLKSPFYMQSMNVWILLKIFFTTVCFNTMYTFFSFARVAFRWKLSLTNHETRTNWLIVESLQML